MYLFIYLFNKTKPHNMQEADKGPKLFTKTAIHIIQ